MSVVEQCNTLPREAVKSPPTQILQTQLDMLMGKLFPLTLFEQGLE